MKAKAPWIENITNWWTYWAGTEVRLNCDIWKQYSGGTSVTRTACDEQYISAVTGDFNVADIVQVQVLNNNKGAGMWRQELVLVLKRKHSLWIITCSYNVLYLVMVL